MMYEVGDIARLKSGGPRMTVEGIEYSGEIVILRCVWFDGSIAERSVFVTASIVKVN